MKMLNTLLTERPEIGIAGGATGTAMSFIDALTKVGQCCAVIGTCVLTGYTLYLKIKNKDNAKGRKNE